MNVIPDILKVRMLRFCRGLTPLLILSGIVFHSCVDIYELDKYKQPEWLAGKLYTQISQQEDLRTFSKCLELTGYDTLLDLSGSFTVFAPCDEAFSQYLSDHPEYGNDVANIPMEELRNLVKYHIIQDAWSREQFKMLDAQGWIDPTDKKSKPRAYKRQTLLRDPNKKYWIDYDAKKGRYSIVDSIEADYYRIAVTRSRKYVPIFFQEFLDLYNLSPSDYEFYFNRPFEPGYLYYAGGRINDEEIFAENGFIYPIDRVVPPLLNAEQLLDKGYPGNESYRTFLDLIYQFPQFEFNREETIKQAAAREGRKFDSLFNLSFPDLPFDINNELTGPNTSVSRYTYVYHNGVFVPTDEAFQKFIEDVVTVGSGYPHWRRFEDVPVEVKKIIVNTHFISEPLYKSDIINGFQDSEGNIIKIDPSTIIRKEYGSNCTFLGLSETIMPRAFGSVTGPVYLRPGYSIFMLAMQKAKVLPALTRQNAEYCFFPIEDQILVQDSSLLINWIDLEANRYYFSAFSRAGKFMQYPQPNQLAKRILNQVGTSIPTRTANKEFIETLGGNFIVWNNSDNTVQGGIPQTYGFMGDSVILATPIPLEEPADNGVTYSLNSWFRPPGKQLFSGLSGYPYFMALLEKAGLYNPKTYEFKFLVPSEYYTIFIPHEQALIDYGVDTLSKEDLSDLLKYHFVRGERIFTDGKKLWKQYETLRKDELSTQFLTVYSNLNIRPSPDKIEILDADGKPYVTILEQDGTTNIMIGTDTDEGSSDEADIITTIIIHEIDKVLTKEK